MRQGWCRARKQPAHGVRGATLLPRHGWHVRMCACAHVRMCACAHVRAGPRSCNCTEVCKRPSWQLRLVRGASREPRVPSATPRFSCSLLVSFVLSRWAPGRGLRRDALILACLRAFLLRDSSLSMGGLIYTKNSKTLHFTTFFLARAPPQRPPARARAREPRDAHAAKKRSEKAKESRGKAARTRDDITTHGR